MNECSCKKCRYWDQRYTLSNISDKKFRFFPWWNESPAREKEWLDAAIRQVENMIRVELGR